MAIRIVTGIEGLDQLLEGGFCEGSINIISGTPGTGKTIFGMQFLKEGATSGEKGMYVSLEESVADITKNLTRFNWDLAKLSQDGLIQFHEFKITPVEFAPIEGIKTPMKQFKVAEPASIADLYAAIKDTIEKGDVKRVVIDSLSLLKFMHEEEKESRAELASLLRFFKKHNVTVLMTAERKTMDDVFDFEDFLADSVILLRDYPGREERKRGITVLKMRGAKCDRTTRPYAITDAGIVVYPNEYIL